MISNVAYTQNQKSDSVVFSSNGRAKDIPQFLPDMKPDHLRLFGDSGMMSLGNGMLTNESSISSYRDPYTLSEKKYSRFYGSQKANILGIPLIVDYYYTTESQTIYNSNSITVSLDMQKLKKPAIDKSLNKERLNEKVQQLEKEKERITNEKLKIEGILSEDRLRLGYLDNELTTRLKSDLEARKQLIRDTLDMLPDTNNLNTAKYYALLNKYDSISAILDTVSIMDNPGFQGTLKDHGLIDKDIWNKLEQIQYKTDHKKQALEKIQKKEEELNKKITEVKRQKDNLKNINPLRKSDFVQSVQSFKVGVFYPRYAELALNSLTVKGVEAVFANENSTFSFGGGKALRLEQQAFSANGREQKFDRGFVGYKLERQWSNKFTMIYSTSGIWDTQKTGSFYPTANLLNSIGYRYKIKWLVSELEWTTSNYFETTHQYGTERYGDMLGRTYNYQSLKDNSGMLAKNEFRINPELKFRINGRMIGPGFRSLGNPFLNNDFGEIEIGGTKQLISNRIEIDAYYKRLQTNLSKLQSYTSRMHGYGVRMNTRFKKWPNLMLSYSPYEQGNNHPDTLYRIQNNFHVFTSVLSYKTAVKKTMLLVNAMYMNSLIENESLEEPIFNEAIAVSVSMDMTKFQNGITYTKSRTQPGVDSMNFYGINWSGMYKLSQKSGIMMTAFVSIYKNTAYRLAIKPEFILFVIKGIQIKPGFEYGRINKLFGLKDQKVYEGTLSVSYIY